MSTPRERVAARAELVRRSARVERAWAGAPRYLFVAALAILCLAGVRAIVSPAEPATGQAAPAAVDNAAHDFAQRFARAYLTYDDARPGVRERLLRPLVPSEFALDAGLATPRGSQDVLWTQVASNQEAIAGGRIVVVAVGVSTQEEPVYLSVPLTRAEGALSLTAYPSFVGPPISARTALPDRVDVEEPEVLAVARRAIGNYLAGERSNLNADLGRDAVVSPPAQPLRLRSVDDVLWAGEEGSSAVLVTLAAADAQGAEWTLTYELGIARERGRVVVTFIETVPTDP